ncbi:MULTISPECIES: hypothetical protein [unclassified Planococcus (in: firmicutes)]|uniref:hypothetical protein n=1 Tax=unclassified Planococcus (in: firmicutes) TaxID=2662419 RepID=UPI000C7C8364|nr:MULTISPECIES: hypothetical protein [unclassified Planococcus (in: firmicutes)]PKG44387.1 hypothetical protein CXF66_17625 [Planococcus sp. Urea-trap-24]PKG89703.1 hypothetical protein CXF91_05830 [Planococcus sp. Urea-3u-39]PKH39167.1 hypothetical protein CXF77_10285 [Planococcus sp. MB-3u-09]
MEEPEDYEISREKLNDYEIAKLNATFKKINREKIAFITGDIVITEDNKSHKFEEPLSETETLDIIQKWRIKSLYPVESSFDFK